MTTPIDTHELFEDDADLPIEELPDGSARVVLPSEDQSSEQTSFTANLAETLDPFTLNVLASDLQRAIESDEEARKKRDQQYEEGLRRTGLGDDAPGGADFDGASDAVHPVMAEGCVDFAARTIKELCPANGPVKIKIVGEADEQRRDKARRKRDYLNWLLTEKITEYRPEKEIMLTQLPLGGSQYEKFWFDHQKKRICTAFTPIDRIRLPYAANSFYTSPRITELQDITRDEFEARIRNGLYREVQVPMESGMPDQTASEKANDKIEGLQEVLYNEDGLRRVYEIVVMRDDLGDDELRPYIVHLDQPTNKVLGIYRNWEENDPTAEPLEWMTENKFIPWRGAYGIGLPHLIGGLAGSLTGALRALLDSAHINNSPGAVKLKGGRNSGANVQVAQTQVQEIDAPAGVDDIRKVMMPLPFNPPSPVLFQLLDWITAQAKGVVATAEERIADASNQMPVGTTLALIEQGSQVFSAIHSRLHESQKRGFKIIARLIRQHPEAHAEDLARFGLTPEDFSDLTGIEPVSDPTIFSEAQRFAQFQAGLQLAQQMAQTGVQINFQVLGRRGFELLRMDGVDEFLPKSPEPVTADPITENAAAMRGTPIKAAPPQDHLAHVMAHIGFIVNPVNTLIPSPMPQLGGLFAHIQEHLLMLYEVTAQAKSAIVQMQNPNLSPEQAVMRGAQAAQQEIAGLLSDVAPMFQAAGKVVQEKMPPPPMDPAIKATYDVGMAEVQRKAALDKSEQERKAAELQSSNQLEKLRQTLDARAAEAKAASDMQIAVMREESAKQLSSISSQVELMKNDADNKQKQITELLKNRDDNQTAVLIAQLKEQLTAVSPQQPQQDNSMLQEMQKMLGELQKAKTDDALSAVMQGLSSLIEGQRTHQERMTGLAGELLRSDRG